MTFDTWIFMATLLFIGVKMVMDPEGSASFPHEVADAILDRFVHNSHKIDLKGKSIRENNGIDKN